MSPPVIEPDRSRDSQGEREGGAELLRESKRQRRRDLAPTLGDEAREDRCRNRQKEEEPCEAHAPPGESRRSKKTDQRERSAIERREETHGLSPENAGSPDRSRLERPGRTKGKRHEKLEKPERRHGK